MCYRGFYRPWDVRTDRREWKKKNFLVTIIFLFLWEKIFHGKKRKSTSWAWWYLIFKHIANIVNIILLTSFIFSWEKFMVDWRNNGIYFFFLFFSFLLGKERKIFRIKILTGKESFGLSYLIFFSWSLIIFCFSNFTKTLRRI